MPLPGLPVGGVLPPPGGVPPCGIGGGVPPKTCWICCKSAGVKRTGVEGGLLDVVICVKLPVGKITANCGNPRGATKIVPPKQKIRSGKGGIPSGGGGGTLPAVMVPRIPMVAVFVSIVKFCGAFLPMLPVMVLKAPWLNLNLALELLASFRYSSILKSLSPPKVITVLSSKMS